jgi:hypothetical protein
MVPGSKREGSASLHGGLYRNRLDDWKVYRQAQFYVSGSIWCIVIFAEWSGGLALSFSAMRFPSLKIQQEHS